jgi:hypothetical protein
MLPLYKSLIYKRCAQPLENCAILKKEKGKYVICYRSPLVYTRGQMPSYGNNYKTLDSAHARLPSTLKRLQLL